MDPNSADNLENKDKLRAALIGQMSSDPARLAQYRKEIQMTLEKNERGLRRERIGVTLIWFVLVAMSTVLLVIGQRHSGTTQGLWFGILACFWMPFGAVELLKHFINRARVELLKEIKGIELQMLQLQEQLRSGGDRS